jgi:hypothetical protein
MIVVGNHKKTWKKKSAFFVTLSNENEKFFKNQSITCELSDARSSTLYIWRVFKVLSSMIPILHLFLHNLGLFWKSGRGLWTGGRSLMGAVWLDSSHGVPSNATLIWFLWVFRLVSNFWPKFLTRKYTSKIPLNSKLKILVFIEKLCSDTVGDYCFLTLNIY